MSTQPSLAETLRMTSTMLRAIRRIVSDAGHVEAMHEIDTLVGIAQAECDRYLAEADPKAQTDER